MAALLVLCLLTVTGAAFAEPLEDLEVAADETECLEIDAGDDEQEAVPEEAGLLLEDPQEAMMPAEEDSLLLYDGAQGGAVESTFAGEEMERTGEEGSDGDENKAVPLTITYVGPAWSKVYDKTTAVKSSSGKWLLGDRAPTTADFVLETEEGHTDVKIAKIKFVKGFTGVDVGEYEMVLSFELKGNDAAYYTPQNVTLLATITKRPVTVTPVETATVRLKDGSKQEKTVPLTKTYGESDPSMLLYKVSGLLSWSAAEKKAGKTDSDRVYRGQLSRVAGENAGKYRITLGTLEFINAQDEVNTNYDVTLAQAYYTIQAKDVGKSDVKVSPIADQYYTGKALKPNVGLTYAGKTLKSGTDYKLSYKSNKNPGTAKITVTGKGNYKGTRTVKFRIVVKPTSLSKLTAGKKRFTASWKKGGKVTGYQISYSLKKDFSAKKTVTVKGVKTTKKVIKGLKAKKTYYVRIRTYRQIGTKKYYSAWSDAMKVKTK